MTSVDTCHWHPDRETGLHCSRCGKPVCVECMRQHPVGIRCKECASELRLPTFQVSREYYVKGIAAAVGLGIAGGIALAVLMAVVPAAGFFFFILMGGLGYALGEGVGYAVNRRRGRPYQYMALGAVLLATAPLSLDALFSLSFGALIALVGIGISLSVAWQRRAP
jgi:hypothetical protein